MTLTRKDLLKVIAKSIADFAIMLKGNFHDVVSVSSIIVRSNNSDLKEKGCEANAHLIEKEKEQTKSTKSRYVTP